MEKLLDANYDYYELRDFEILAIILIENGFGDCRQILCSDGYYETDGLE